MKYLILASLIALPNILWAATEEGKTNFLYFNPIQSAMATDYNDVTTLTFGYEKFFTGFNSSVNIPVSLGYDKENDLTAYSLGGGLILKKYLLNQMRGGYPFILVQGTYSKSNLEYQYRDSGNQNSNIMVYDAGVGYGYLWTWKQIILDWNLGAKMEFADSDAELKLLGNIGIGFPF